MFRYDAHTYTHVHTRTRQIQVFINLKNETYLLLKLLRYLFIEIYCLNSPFQLYLKFQKNVLNIL